MIVQCPSCHTRYRTDRSLIIDETTRFQCTKEECGHTFFYSPPLLEGVGHDTPAARPRESQSASPLPPISEDILTIPSDEAFPQEAPALTKPTEPLDEEPLDQPEIAETFGPAETPFYTDSEAAEKEYGLETSDPPAWAEPEVIISPGIFLSFVGFLVFTLGLLSIYCFYHPEHTEAALSRLPLLNSLIAGERFSTQHITLSNLNGRSQLTKDNQRVFAVSGIVTNNATVPARTIQLEGAIYDATGKVVGQRLIFCGTNIAPDRLVNLTLREIGALQDLVPPKQFHIAAGGAVKFLIVFPFPSSGVAEFSSRVVTAQFE